MESLNIMQGPPGNLCYWVKALGVESDLYWRLSCFTEMNNVTYTFKKP